MPVFVSPVVVTDGNAADPALHVMTPLTVTLEGVIAPRDIVATPNATAAETPLAVAMLDSPT
jgi:hypothetical protein